MAKGFSVQAKTPPAKEPEWDYDRARELLKGKKIVFCLPGRGVSYTYLKNLYNFVLILSSRSKHSDLARLQFNGELCTLQVSWC